MAAVTFPMVDPWREGGRPDAVVYRRRRAVALLMLVVALAMATTMSRLALAGSGGGALTTAGSSGAPAAPVSGRTPPLPASAHRYVVQPGDTLWSIVATSHPGRDPRAEVDRLALQLNGRALQPGQRLLLP